MIDCVDLMEREDLREGVKEKENVLGGRRGRKGRGTSRGVKSFAYLARSLTNAYAYKQCSQPSRPDCRALASNSPVRPGRGWYGRPGKASVLTISRKTAGPGRQPTVLQLISSSGRASPSLELTGVICRARPS